jgi:hypothetical protein
MSEEMGAATDLELSQGFSVSERINQELMDKVAEPLNRLLALYRNEI